MNTTQIKRFAQYARKALIEQVSIKLDEVLAVNSLARRDNLKAVLDLESEIKKHSQEEIIDRVAYTWFNRFCALRFMDVMGYNKIQVLSPSDAGQFQPEILAEAKQGHIDESIIPTSKHKEIFDLLEGRVTSNNAQNEAYKLLIIAVSNYWYDFMPFLFEKINDYTELLMPDDVLSGTSIIAFTREALTPANCKDVEVLGWLYQYYISEKKDEVFEGLKKNKKITSENIPAATQLFTPNWIVRYLVDNSLGRLWLLNKPNSSLADKMEYYIKPEEPEKDFLKISSPEELKVLDPACGSGHMLVYAFDLLYAIYEEAGYDTSDIPRLILEKNLYGIEIDERAGELASFALMMKAREKQRRFFNKKVSPNICVLEDIHFDEDELNMYFLTMGNNQHKDTLRTLFTQFEESKNFGSLIRPIECNIQELTNEIEKYKVTENMLLQETYFKAKLAIKQADFLQQKYHVVIANPPYMGGKGMNASLADFAKHSYPNSKSDLFAMFIERGMDLILPNGYSAMVTMQSWMFLSSYEKMRKNIVENYFVTTMAHLGTRAFDSIGGEVVSTTAFTIKKEKALDYKGSYLRLIDGSSEAEKQKQALEAINNPNCACFYRASAENFQKIPGSPIAYWASEKVVNSFTDFKSLGELAEVVSGMTTGDNDKYMRDWKEVSYCNIALNQNDINKVDLLNTYWFPYNKGGAFRRWYGNNNYVVNWSKSHEFNRAKTTMTHLYLKKCITWSDITSSIFSARACGVGFLFDVKGSCAFPSEHIYNAFIALLNTKISMLYIKMINPSVTTQVGDLQRIPFNELCINEAVNRLAQQNISLSQTDWDSDETSWDFKKHPLV